MFSQTAAEGGPRPPALRVTNGEFADAPPEWHVLEQHRAKIERTLLSVGRIRQGAFILGTGFLVARHVVMTNRHVVESFTIDVGGTLKIRVGWHPIIDFVGEHPTIPSTTQAEDASPCGRCEIRRILYVDWELDLALLRVAFDDESRGHEPWQHPEPLHLSDTTAPVEQRPIYLVGFPRYDRSADPEELSTVFGDPFGVKRVQPGFITRVKPGEFEHDCSTLKGNSGSCVVDLESNEVMGLHCSGSRRGEGGPAFNRAIAFAALPPGAKKTLEYAGVEI